MLIPTTRMGWQLRFSPSTAASAVTDSRQPATESKQQTNRTYHDKGLAEQHAMNYRQYLKEGETVEVVPVEIPIELRWQVQTMLTVIRQTNGDEFADQVTDILEAYGQQQYDNGADSERQVSLV
jgi:hypothetical protein